MYVLRLDAITLSLYINNQDNIVADQPTQNSQFGSGFFCQILNKLHRQPVNH